MESSNINIIVTASEKVERKTQEKIRRIQMKYLTSKLFSLIPPHPHQSTKVKIARLGIDAHLRKQNMEWAVCAYDKSQHIHIEIFVTTEMESSNVNIVGISTSQKQDRKTQEKNRRIQMKYLSSKLLSLIPSNYSKEVRTKQDHVDQAITYIGELKERVEVLKKRKEEVAQGTSDHSRKSMSTTSCTIKTPNMVEVRELDSTLEVIILTSGLQKNFTLQEVIKIIEEEGAQVVTANYSTLEDAIYYTIHAQVKITRLGVDASSIHLRLQNLLC
ncbi:hypothetical protein MTR67_014987 [Solanum verrucosum]|uniref:BHLH domain-containing protein n=1 Tax=Solanum verrucosum TaxID=315347 RepID=A0AAF0QEY4_SOLVR|nr:hypothetical protein MTR67_014987 [Solanum verrucosum]